MISTAEWAAARKLAGSMSLKPTSCWSSSSGVSVCPPVDAWVVSVAILLVPECGPDRGRRPRVPTECNPAWRGRPPNGFRRHAQRSGRRAAPADRLLQGQSVEEVLWVRVCAGLGHHQHHVKAVSNECNSEV